MIPYFVLVIFLSLANTSRAFNLDYRIPVVKRGAPRSFFGYSVAEHQELTQDSTRISRNHLLVGAPRANTTQPESNSPGNVYKCPITTRFDDCMSMDVNDKPQSDEIADDGWLGVSLKSRGPGGQVVACAHRYKKKEDENIWGQGMCHLFKQDLTAEDIAPLEACGGMKTNRGHEDFGFCQAGTSAELAEDGTLAVGAPGGLNWRGGLFSIAVSREEIGQDKRWFWSEINEARQVVEKVSYLGMSVTSGFYLGVGKQMVYVAGAPRSNLTGEVFLFRKQTDGKNRTLELLGKLEGEQVACQFGYSLASVDLNNDSLPDLIIGAPFYFQNVPPRGGAVYIYMNNEDGVQYAEPKKLFGPPDSSFGFAIANAGDLNLDGYSDLAVGAPYDGQGSIYIFQGSANGIVSEPSQIIRAIDLPVPMIFTLGYSLSGGIDMDGNGYPDLLSGAYKSDHVVMLRARPVIKVTTEVNELPEYVSDPRHPPQLCLDSSGNKNLTCFSFRPCFQIASQSLNNFNGQMSIEYRIEAETFQKSSRVQYSRVKFQAGEPQSANVVSRIIVVTQRNWNNRLCDESTAKEIVLIHDTTKDVLNPIWFKLTYTLILENATFPRQGDPLPQINDYPILDQTNASKIFQVKFYKDCGTNDVCESDLRLAATLSLPKDSNETYVLSLGENNQISLNITLRNEHEAAYLTQLFVQYPATLEYIAADNRQYLCSQVKDIPFLIRCDVGNPFPRNGEANISMRFNTSDLQPLDREVGITVYANTTSNSVESPQEPLVISANIVVRADIEIRGASDPLELFYSGVVTGASAMHKEEEIGLSVNHTFEIRNRGPAKVSSSKVVIRWPLEVENGHKHGKYLLYLLQEPILDGPITCHVDPSYINPIGVKRTPIAAAITAKANNMEDPPKSPMRNAAFDGNAVDLSQKPEVHSRVKREKIVQHEERLMENGKKIKVVRLDCDRGTAKCINITCQIRELTRDQPVVIRLRARLWNSTFIEDYQEIDTIEIKSHAEVYVDTAYFVEDAKGNNVATALTLAKPDVSIKKPTGGVAWWIILLAILGALLLLALLIFILYRCGFFARKSRFDEAQAPRRNTPSDKMDDFESTRMSPQSDR